MKRLLLTRKQLFKLNEESINISAQAKSNDTSEFINAASNPTTMSDIQKAGVAGDVNLVVNGPNADDTQPQQVVNVAKGDTVQNAINTQANDELIRNGGSVKISGDGFGEARIFTKQKIEEVRLDNMRKNGKILTKKELKESINK